MQAGIPIRMCPANIKVETFKYSMDQKVFQLVDFGSLSVGAVFGAMCFGLLLSLLFFMDQNIIAATVNSLDNKGIADHWDLGRDSPICKNYS
jgi:sodium borate transporter 11